MIRRNCFVACLIFASLPFGSSPALCRNDLSRPEKIGHRNVARQGTISQSKEYEIGTQFAVEFERQVKFIQDPWIGSYIKSIADRIVRNSDLRSSVNVKVIQSDSANSFSIPGGFIYLTSGLLREADYDDEIAGVIAHQVAHAAARHWASKFTKMMLVHYAILPLLDSPNGKLKVDAGLQEMQGALACPGIFNWGDVAGNEMPYPFLQIARSDELEADFLGLQYMYKAGYSPGTYIALLQKLTPKSTPGKHPEDSFSPLPPLEERVVNARNEIKKIMPDAVTAPKTTSDFLLLKSHL
jgi:predicted Zn-dependent protease